MRLLLTLFVVLFCSIPAIAQFNFNLLSTYSEQYHAVASNGYYLIGNREGALDVLNISDPSNPFLQGSLPLTSSGNVVALDDTLVYTVDGNNMIVCSFANPAAPQLLATIPFPYPPLSIHIDGSLLVSVNAGPGVGRIYTFDNSDPYNPVGQDVFAYNQQLGKALYKDSTLYISILQVGNTQGEAIDVSDPNNILPQTTLVMQSWSAWDLVGNHILAIDDNEVRKYNLNDPYSPLLEEAYTAGTGAIDLLAIDSTHYVARDLNQLRGLQATGGSALDEQVHGSDSSIYVTGKLHRLYYCTATELRILEYTTNIHTSIGSMETPSVVLYPNPAQKSIAIRGSKNAELYIYDQQQRLVKIVQIEENETLDVSTWARGIYTYRMIPEDQERLITGTIVLQ